MAARLAPASMAGAAGSTEMVLDHWLPDFPL